LPSNHTIWPLKFPTGFEKSPRLVAFRRPKCSSGHSHAASTTCGGPRTRTIPRRELDREEAIEHVGRTKVERTEREREVVEDDVDWGLNA
jgi:hypothetical protein